MPELPEVETLLRQLSKTVEGSRIESIAVHDPRVLNVSSAVFKKRLEGECLTRITRRGKYLCFPTESGKQLWFHLGMTGRLLLAPECKLPHTHVEIAFKGIKNRLFFSDPRRFGRVIFHEGDSAKLPEGIRLTAPDPFQVTPEAFAGSFRNRKAPIKSLLLNQRLVSGVGNIYADESLFRAGIHPKRKASALSRARLMKLHRFVCVTLEEAIHCGGSSVDDYRHLDGQKGGFQNRHQVYGRGGRPCPVCQKEIRVIRLAGRSSHYCPVCQK